MADLSFTAYLKDPIYGLVGITDKEQKIIQTKTFHRLKNIKQLGTANFIYPGANHSRFEHSIGVMHVTSLMLDRLGAECEHKQLIRIAALLHDIGHGPFSHSFEEVLVRNPQYEPSVNGVVLKNHEDFSDYIIMHDAELRSIMGADLKMVSDFLSRDKPIDNIPPEIVTGDMGSDRIDYLIRDTYYTGLGHRPDIDSLISNMKLSTVNPACPRITITEEGILAVELLITTRYYHFSMIANNPKNRTVELLFIKLLEAILQKEEDPKEFMFEAYTKFDDSIILSKLFNYDSSLKDLFYHGKGLNELYRISLNDIRSGLAKYCIYRFFYDTLGLKEYSTKVEDTFAKNSGLQIVVDLHLFKHGIPDIILYKEKYETEKEWVSPFTVDHSNILKQIPAEQLIRSSISILNETAWENQSEIIEKINKDRFFLTTDFLAPFSRDRISKEFQEIDYFYTFLSALRDFYSEKNWKSDAKKEELFRGIGRFYTLAKICNKELGVKLLPLKKFYKESGEEPFEYSVKGFSILNSFNTLGFLRMDYIPVKPDKLTNKPYHRVYVIKPMEFEIRRKLYEGLPLFDEYRNNFLEIFRALSWKDYFEDFFPLKTN